MPRSFVATMSVLLPKKTSPATWADFWPISLCNVTSKIISKLLTRRLSSVLTRVVSPEQSGFVAGRSIHDNVLLVQELVSEMRAGRAGGNVILKLDMAKAYDRMSWPFILQMFRSFGFSELWISFIQRVISSPMYSVLVNGASHGFFPSGGGVRQGDPLSPSIFILAAEFLSRGLKRLFADHPEMKYGKVNSPLVSHLAFADDIVIFVNGRRDNLERLMGFLQHYQDVSGKLISKPKSRFFLKPGSTIAQHHQVGGVTGFLFQDFPFTYLGCPVFIGRMLVRYFSGLLQRFR